jgi:hypothetical protein
MKKILAMAALALLTACGSIMHGGSQDIGISSSPTNADVSIDGLTKGHTPVIANLSRKDNHIVRLTLPGYAPAELTLTRGVSGWVWGNLAGAAERSARQGISFDPHRQGRDLRCAC